jgi:hypothetical protein
MAFDKAAEWLNHILIDNWMALSCVVEPSVSKSPFARRQEQRQRELCRGQPNCPSGMERLQPSQRDLAHRDGRKKKMW